MRVDHAVLLQQQYLLDERNYDALRLLIALKAGDVLNKADEYKSIEKMLEDAETTDRKIDVVESLQKCDKELAQELIYLGQYSLHLLIHCATIRKMSQEPEDSKVLVSDDFADVIQNLDIDV